MEHRENHQTASETTVYKITREMKDTVWSVIQLTRSLSTRLKNGKAVVLQAVLSSYANTLATRMHPHAQEFKAKAVKTLWVV